MANRRVYIRHQGLDQEELQAMARGPITVRRKLVWQYSPDRLEQWLEDMELAGYNLLRVNWLGTSYFFNCGSPRRVRYCVDYEPVTNRGYFDTHRDAGWRSVYTSFTSFARWIWAQEYPEGDPPPQLYSDRLHRQKHARKVAQPISVC